MHKSVFKFKKWNFLLTKAYKRDEHTVPSSETLNTKTYRSFEEIPGPKSYRYVGTLYKYLPFIGDYSTETLDKNGWLSWRRYGPLARESILGTRILHVFHPDDVEALFRQEDRLPARRSHIAMEHYRLSKPELYNTGGLLATNGPEWWRLRSAFQKNFTSPKSIREHVDSIDAVLKEFIQWMKHDTISPRKDFLPYLNRLNLEIIGVVAFKERFNSFSPEEQNKASRSSKVISAAFGSNSGIMKLDSGFLWRLFRTPLYAKLAKSQECLEKVATDILYRNVDYYKDTEKKRNKSLLESFLQQSGVDLKDIRGIMVDILMASIDTTAYSTSFALYHLARNPECQEKLYKEVSNLLPEEGSVITSDVLTKAVYTRSCVKESLRLNPVSVGIGRWLHKDIVLRGYLIPKGTVIVTQNMVSSCLPQHVRSPLVFKPERWLRDSDQFENIHPFLSLPFGFGPRSCIARRLAEQNIYITLIRLIKEFKMSWKGKELGIQTHLINKPDKPVRLVFEPRSCNNK